MDIVGVILPTLIIQVAAEYYTPDKALQWKEAVKKCNMAVPDLHPTPNGYNVSINYNVNNGDVWIGYFMKMVVFDYIGCVKLYNQRFTQLGRGNSPGMCYTFCKRNEMIGVSKGKCICVDTLENHSKHETGCNKSCGASNKGVACGGSVFMSVYKVNKNANSGSRETPCLSFQQYDQNKVEQFTWENCSEYHPEVCEKELNIGADRPNHPWLPSINNCFKKGLLPASYQDLRQTRRNISLSWSGVISSDVIYTYTEWNKNLQGVRFGYMSANRSVYFIDTDEPRFALCNSSETEWSTAMSTSPADSERGHSTTIIVTKNTSTSQQSHTNSQGQDVSVIIGVSVSASVVIIAVVTAFIILRRRGKLLSLPCSSGQDVVIKDKVNKTSTVIKDSSSETVNSEQDHYTALSQTEYINDSHTYNGLELSNSDHSAFGHERNLSLENGNI